MTEAVDDRITLLEKLIQYEAEIEQLKSSNESLRFELLKINEQNSSVINNYDITVKI